MRRKLPWLLGPLLALLPRGLPGEEEAEDLSIWLAEDQVQLFSGIRHMMVHVVANGMVMPYLLDRNLETHLPVLPPEVEEVRFRWQAPGRRAYTYNFYRLESHDQHLLLRPTIDISARGRIPRQPAAFTVRLPCTGNLTGIASFSIGLEIRSKRRQLAGTPLKLRLRKECLALGPHPACSRSCRGRGLCDGTGRCLCRAGWEGERCAEPICAPQCMNGGTCSAPGVCGCPAGFQGRSCEGGVCSPACRHGGRCVQRDTCRCRAGYYGARCEFSKCVVPCLNGGHCKGVNKCRCEGGHSGDHCQVLPPPGGSGSCSRQECRRFKQCRKANCGHIGRLDRNGMRQCKATFCGPLPCSRASCGRKKRRRRKMV